MNMLPPFRLEAHFSQWEFRAPHNLAGSEGETWSLKELLRMAGPEESYRWATLHLGYTQTFGDPALRSAIAGMYQRMASDDVICFAGGQEALYCAIHAILEPGDHSVVVVPGYQSVEEVAGSIGQVTGVMLRPAGDSWELDVTEIRRAITGRTRMLAMNFPNNPTGTIIPQEQFVELLRLAAERGIYVLSDEAYRGFERRPELRLPNAADLYERALSCGVMSKAFGLGGLRIGWIACGQPEMIKRLEQVKHYLSISGSGPSEVLAGIAIRSRESIWQRNNALANRNAAELERFFDRWRPLFAGTMSAGGCICFPRDLGDEGVEAFCASALSEAGILLLPASVFHSRLAMVPSDRLRIGFGRAAFPQHLKAFDRFLEQRIGADGRRVPA